MNIQSFPVAPETDSNELEHRRKLARTLNRTIGGKLNAITTVTLTQSAASTTITDRRITPQSFIGLMPTTANAAAALATTYIPDTTKTTGSAVIQHANNAQNDKSFVVLIIG